MTKRRMVSLFVVCALILFVFVGCRNNEFADDGIQGTAETNQEGIANDIMEKTDEFYGDIEIATPYIGLHYPEKWLNYLKIKKNFEEESNVTFFACINGKKDVELFTLHFNEDGAMPIGVLNLESNSVYIAFSYAEIKYDNTWTQNEKDIVNAMQEQINYIINCLEE